MTPGEKDMAKRWHAADGKAPSEIATLLNRNKSTITRLLKSKGRPCAQGRPHSLSPTQLGAVVKRLDAMVKAAQGEYRVTANMLKKDMRLKCTVRTLLTALHKKGVYFRPMRQKPLLTDQDVIDRKAFANKYAVKPADWWLKGVHLTIDVKYFKVFLGQEARSRAAKEGTWGAFRTKGQGLEAPYVRPSRRLKWNPGVRGVHVLAGVGNGKVMVWEYIDGRRWTGAVAAECYRGPIAAALSKEYPQRKTFTVLEDNDPTGFRSKAGLAAKESAGIKTFEIPKRSPSLNVCDYALWTEVNKRMRAQEKRMPSNKRESRAEFLKRLKRTALRLPSSFVDSSIKQMRKRCQRLQDAKGGHFEEGH